MFLQLNIKTPLKTSEKVEEVLYQADVLGWETQEVGEFANYLVYPKGQAQAEELLKVLSEIPEVEVSTTWIKEENWAEMWKKNFKPLKVGKRLIIAPPWEVPREVNSSEVLVVIEPGQAFGTGHHPTTQLMLKHIEEFASSSKPDLKVLDLGCGTAILSVALLKLLPKAKVWAIDIDKDALSAGMYNAKLNDLEDKIIFSEEIPLEKFDLIMANIGFRELKKLAEKITEVANTNACAFLSGILSEDKEKLLQVYTKLGWKLKKAEDLREWGFLWISRQSK